MFSTFLEENKAFNNSLEGGVEDLNKPKKKALSFLEGLLANASKAMVRVAVFSSRGLRVVNKLPASISLRE